MRNLQKSAAASSNSYLFNLACKAMECVAKFLKETCESEDKNQY